MTSFDYRLNDDENLEEDETEYYDSWGMAKGIIDTHRKQWLNNLEDEEDEEEEDDILWEDEFRQLTIISN